MIKPTTPIRDSRIEVRLSSDHKQLIERAAQLNGQSLSEYSVSNLLAIARRAIDNATVTRLSDRDRDAFMAMLDDNVEPNEALQRASARYHKQRG